ncbi:hypothetical protein SBOR_0733 [Sclerotinia borealis F-4128]|uniref:Uncharacterized protein n=1 Tax=Sclerotinia borealis (strain F-4128) TaxID=1432307 RepID=W9CWF5_SCLBF|nr:hypothetical protein SBOR_0733 [Sclerotinia borealis F-4128]
MPATPETRVPTKKRASSKIRSSLNAQSSSSTSTPSQEKPKSILRHSGDPDQKHRVKFTVGSENDKRDASSEHRRRRKEQNAEAIKGLPKEQQRLILKGQELIDALAMARERNNNSDSEKEKE